MSTAARIDELRKKFEENPRRYFAPLANELRKAGDLTQAIALCREHLPKQPGHMSGYIVFGQALYDCGDLDEARLVFEQALALDPENLIALHHLGHIAKRQGFTAAARRWYERALETDPRNDDIAHQLATLVTPALPQAAVPSPVVAPPVIAEAESTAAPAADEAGPELTFLDTGATTPWHDGEAVPTPPSVPAADADRAEPTPEPAFAAETPIDLDFSDVPVAVPEGEAQPDDPFDFNVAPQTELIGEVEASSTVDLEAAFEEGLVTAGWPDASDFALRPATPRSVTPPSMEVPPDAAEAFGREPEDPIIAAMPEPEPDVFDLDADAAIARSDDPVAEVADASIVVPVADGTSEVVAEVATEVAANVEVEMTADDVEADAATELEPVAEAAAEVAGDVPWETASVTPVEDLTAILAAMEEDARALGEAPGAHAEEPFGDFESEDPQVPAFVTETMGELLVAQGFLDRAVAVYEELVRRRPYDPVLTVRLAELREQATSATPFPVFTARERYATLAARRVVRRTPAQSQPAVVTMRAPTPVGTTAMPHAPTPRTASAVTADDSLTALFGSPASAHDDIAAQALAEAFAPLPLDEPSQAAFDMGFLGGSNAPRVPTPAYGAVRQPTPVVGMPVAVPPPAPAEPASEFSFDRFFPDPAASAMRTPDAPSAAPPVGESSSTSTPDESASAGDDLAQFSAWLKGLGNP